MLNLFLDLAANILLAWFYLILGIVSLTLIGLLAFGLYKALCCIQHFFSLQKQNSMHINVLTDAMLSVCGLQYRQMIEIYEIQCQLDRVQQLLTAHLACSMEDSEDVGDEEVSVDIV